MIIFTKFFRLIMLKRHVQIVTIKEKPWICSFHQIGSLLSFFTSNKIIFFFTKSRINLTLKLPCDTIITFQKYENKSRSKFSANLMAKNEFEKKKNLVTKLEKKLKG